MSRWLAHVPVVAGLLLALPGQACLGSSEPVPVAEKPSAAVPAEGADASSPSAPDEEPARCRLQLAVEGVDGPLASQKIEVRAMRQVDERAWRSVAAESLVTAPDGSAEVLLPCDTRLSLRAPGWMWSNQPARLILRDGMAPLKVIMVPELTVRLFVHGGKGPAAEDVRFHRPGDEIGQPVPREGLVIPGLRMSEVAGEIRSANLPTRQWRPFRSDELEQIRPGMQEAVVVVGDIPSTWLELGAGIKDDVEGVFCLGDGKRGKKCLLHQGVWRCPCPPGASLGLYGPRWDVGVVRSTESADLLLQTLPEAEPLCLRFPEVRAPGSSVAAQPAGIAGGLLLGGLPRPVQPGEELCFKLPRGEPVDLLLRGPVTGSWTVTAAGQGSAELLSH